MRMIKKGIAAYEKTKPIEKRNTAAGPKDTLEPKDHADGKKPRIPERKPELQPKKDLEGFLKSPKEPNGYRKAAKFLLLVGKEEAAKILKHFKPDEIEIITREIADISHIEKAEAEKLLSDFGFLKEKAELPAGGRDAARSMLVAAFGEEKGDAFFRRVVPYAGEKPFSFLNDLELEQIRILLKEEPVQVVALIVPFLEPKKASAFVSGLDPDRRKEIVLRVAKMRRIAPEAIQKTEAVLKERIRTQGKVVTRKIDGSDTLAKILKYMDPGSNEKILQELSDAHPDISESIRDKIFTIDVVLSLSPKDLGLVLRDYADRDIAVLLKGKSGEIRAKILSAVSERRRAMVEAEIGYLGAMKKSEIDAATKEFVDYILKLDGEGAVTLKKDAEEYI